MTAANPQAALEAAFIDTTFQEPVTVLGVRLLPYSAGKDWLLRSLDNAFIRGDVPELGDILTAIIVCAHDHENAVKALSDPELEKDLALWAKKLRGPWWRRIGKKQKHLFGFDFQEVSLALFRYIERGRRYPIVKSETSGEGREIGSPQTLLTVVSLCSKLGFTYEQAINFPLDHARWLVASYGEQEGHLTIVDKDELRAAQEAANELDRRLREEAIGRKRN